MALPTIRRASAVGVTTEKAPIIAGAELREEITLIMAQAATGTDAGVLNTAVEVFSTTNLNGLLGVGIGSPINLATEAFFKAAPGARAFVLPLGDPESGAAATATITTTGTANKVIPVQIYMNGLYVYVSIPLGTSQDNITGILHDAIKTQSRNPFTVEIDAGVTDNVVDVTAICKGTVGNSIKIMITDTDGNAITAARYGADIVVSDIVEGYGVVSTSDAIDGLPDTVSVTRVINYSSADTAALDNLEQFANDRNTPERGDIVRTYSGFRVKTDSVADVNAEYISLESYADSQQSYTSHSLIPTDCNGLEIEAVAELVGRLVNRYTGNPGKPPRGIVLQSNPSRSRSEHWFTSSQRDALYKKGVTNFEKNNGFFKLFDLCSLYHTDNDNILSPNPPVAFNDEDATAIGNMQYSVIQTFKSPTWEAVKFIGNKDISSNPAARKLIDVAAQVDVLVTSWLDYLFVKDIATTKLTKVIKFNDINPERVDMIIPVTLASTGRIYDVILSATKANR